MKYGTKIRLLVVACIAMLHLAGCSKPTEELEDSTSDTPIRVVAEMSKGTGGGRITKGVVEGNTDWREDYIGAEEYEQAVKHVILFAYKHGQTDPVKVFYYSKDTLDQLTHIPEIEGLEKRDLVTNMSSILLDLELMAGYYNFVLLVNCESALEKIKEGTIPDPTQLTEATEVFTSDDLEGEGHKYLPMTGQSDFYVPDNKPGSGMVNLLPNIVLERIHARVEFILTTVDDNGEYISPLLEHSQIKGLTMKHEASGYSVLPSIGEYTATGGGSRDLRGGSYADNLPNGISGPLLPDRENLHDGANEGAVIAKCKDRRLPYVGGKSKYIYVASGIYGKERPLSLTLSVKYYNENEIRNYEMMLYNPDLNKEDEAYYNIRRNTIYRMFSTLRGPNDMEFDIVVDGWVDAEVDIPW